VLDDKLVVGAHYDFAEDPGAPLSIAVDALVRLEPPVEL
jgi:hypothetical protein